MNAKEEKSAKEITIKELSLTMQTPQNKNSKRSVGTKREFTHDSLDLRETLNYNQWDNSAKKSEESAGNFERLVSFSPTHRNELEKIVEEVLPSKQILDQQEFIQARFDEQKQN